MSVHCRILVSATALACLLVAVAAPSASATLRSPRLTTCPKGSKYEEQTRGPFRLEGCIKTETARFITAAGSTKAELSGFDIDLPSGARLALMRTGDPRIVSSGGDIRVRIKGGPVNFIIHEGPLDETSESGATFNFNLDEVDIPAAARLLGLDIEGDVDGNLGFAMQATGTNVSAIVAFPALLSGAKFGVDLGVNDGTGLRLNSLSIAQGSGDLPFNDIPGAVVKELQFKFTAPSSVTVGGKVVLPGLVPQSFGGTLSFNQQGFAGFSGSVSGANLPISPPSPFFFQGGTLNVGVNPLTFGGGITFSAGPVEEATNASIVKSTGGFQFTSGSPSKIKFTGTTSLLNLGPLKFLEANQGATFSSNNVFSIDSSSNLNLTVPGVGGLTANSSFDGSFSKQGFLITGSGTGTFSALGLTLATAGSSVKANGKGYGVCLTGSAFGFTVRGQGRADWGKTPALALGCDLGRFATRALRRVEATAAASGTVVVPPGATNAAVRVRGAAAAPAFNLRLSDGTVLEVRDPKDTVTPVGGRAVHRVDATNTTTVYVTNPPAGTWTVEEIAGQPLAEILSSDDAPPSVTAQVSGDGESRTLTWNAGDLDGGRLQLSEVQADGAITTLVDTDQATGTAEFKVPFGKPGTRQIIAVVTGVDGIPNASIQAGSYLAPKAFVPSPPRDIKASFNKKTKTLTFTQVQPTDPDRRPDYWYYKVSLDDGRVLFLPGSGTQKIKVPGVADDSPFKVSVFGIEREGLQGKPRTEKGKA